MGWSILGSCNRTVSVKIKKKCMIAAAIMLSLSHTHAAILLSLAHTHTPHTLSRTHTCRNHTLSRTHTRQSYSLLHRESLSLAHTHTLHCWQWPYHTHTHHLYHGSTWESHCVCLCCVHTHTHTPFLITALCDKAIVRVRFAHTRTHLCVCVLFTHTHTYHSWQEWFYRVAKMHRMSYLYRSFSAEEPYKWWLFCEKRTANWGILCIFATL